ncbi:hypothetical protein CFP65_6610 [Kitasatospora sp. MMS16-BH015]|uniref:hypothetical protein n=1 Tax=Kitasatospora sp. MMS16-BH015 TaxID=2018025 RepID=UPI000CA1962F|nr:hypothetical protein [Kitasatospora sp. MMS16-BH015]AUG81257.1 hypothetical protein CFP65_6610 [Kitasatospora sp. MMS16-BH015]
MTQNGFAGAEQIGATLDVLAEALLDGSASHYPVDSLTAFRRADHPTAGALFGLRLTSTGQGTMTVRGLGTVVEGSSLRGTDADAGLTAELLRRLGAGPVRGVEGAPGEGPTAAHFQLPVTAESSDPGLRPPFPAVLAELAAGRETLVPDELATGAGVEVRLVVPPVFHSVTTRGAHEDRAEHLVETAEELFAGAAQPARRDWALLSAALAEPLHSAGVVFAGLAALSVGGRPSHASLVVSLTADRTPVTELATHLADSRPNAEVWTVLLPAGPAAVLVEGRAAAIPAPLTPDPTRRWAVTSVAQAFVPLPDGATVLTVQLGTVRAEDWDLYAGAFADILKSLQLGWDGVLAPAGPAAPQAAAHPAAQQPTGAGADQATAAAPPAPSEPQQPTAPHPADRPAAAETRPTPPPPAQPAQPAQPAVPPQAPAATATAPAEPKGTPVQVPPADFNPFAPPAPAAATGEPKGTAVNVPPADFNPFAPPAPGSVPAQATPAPAAAAAAFDPFGTPTPAAPAADPFGAPAPARTALASTEAAPTKGTPVQVPPADFNPFAPPAPAPAAAAAEPTGEPKGTPVHVPPADFNPFAPPAPAAATGEPKGTAVNVPPADFNPFAPPAPGTATAAAPAAPVAPAAAPVATPAAADPFGTVTTPKDPFGTSVAPQGSQQAAPPAPIAAPPAPTQPPTAGKATPVHVPPADFNPFAPPAPAAAAAEPAGEPKGTPVHVPPADFNPFAPPAPPAAAAPGEGKGTPVQVPPADFNPFAPQAPSTTAPAAPPAPPEAPANNPFG